MMMGQDGFMWFTGVVEDRKDPDKRGRVRVRIHALHSKEKQINDSTGQGIPTDDLPWATVIRPITSAAMDGIGQTPLGLVEGTWVFGFARDGEAMNDLLILGSIGGKPEDPPDDKGGREGFVDPRSAGEIAGTPRYINEVENRDPGYPGQGIPQGRYPQEKWLNEVDVNRLARAEKLDETLIKPKREDLEKRIPTAFGSLWDEMAIPYGAKYPFNHVFETESGHVMEFDDTKDAERWHLWHKSKSYMEIHPDGKLQLKTQKDFFTVARGHIHAYAEKDLNLTAKKNLGLLSREGNVKIKSALGDVIVDAFGEINMTAKGQNSFHMTSEIGPMTLMASANTMSMASLLPMNMTSLTGSVNTSAPLGSINATALLDISTKSLSGSVDISSLGGNVNLLSAAGSIVGTALSALSLTSLTGAISALANQGMDFVSSLGSINMGALAGSISSVAQSAINMSALAGSISSVAQQGVSMIAQTGNMSLSTLGANGLMNLASGSSLGIDTALGAVNLSTTNPLGTALQSASAVALSSSGGNVSVSSATSNVDISAGGTGEVGVSGAAITLESPNLNFITDDLVLEGQNSVTVRSLVANIDIDSAADITAIAGGALDIQTVGNMVGSIGGDIDLTATGAAALSGTTVNLTSLGVVTISTGGGAFLTLAGPANTASLDAYSAALQAYFDTRYAPIVHNHDADYAAIDHNHDLAYAAIDHVH
jgi:hypothetical protein